MEEFLFSGSASFQQEEELELELPVCVQLSNSAMSAETVTIF